MGTLWGSWARQPSLEKSLENECSRQGGVGVSLGLLARKAGKVSGDPLFELAPRVPNPPSLGRGSLGKGL